MPSSFQPAYLVHGDDHGRIAERRARLRAVAEQESGAAGIEVFEADTCTPEEVAGALNAMTFAMGRRFIVADGVQRWKDASAAPVIEALAGLGADTTVAFFAREEGAQKAPSDLHKAVLAAGGAVIAEQAIKSWDLPKWVVAEARRRGLELDIPAARAFVARVGERQQRLLRELEKLRLEMGPGGRVLAADMEELAAHSAQHRTWTLADALVARDAGAATVSYLELSEQGERLAGLSYWMTQRVRTALDVVTRLDAGESSAQVRKGLRMPPRAAGELIEHARQSGEGGLRRALVRLADLEYETRGGGTLTEETATVRAIAAVTVGP